MKQDSCYWTEFINLFSKMWCEEKEKNMCSREKKELTSKQRDKQDICSRENRDLKNKFRMAFFRRLCNVSKRFFLGFSTYIKASQGTGRRKALLCWRSFHNLIDSSIASLFFWDIHTSLCGVLNFCNLVVFPFSSPKSSEFEYERSTCLWAIWSLGYLS